MSLTVAGTGWPDALVAFEYTSHSVAGSLPRDGLAGGAGDQAAAVGQRGQQEVIDDLMLGDAALGIRMGSATDAPAAGREAPSKIAF
jgi:hypothetical protein